MAYRSGYPTGYLDDAAGYTFTPTAEGYSMPVKVEKQGGEGADYSLWKQYGTAIPVQTTLIYTGGVSALHQTPIWTLIRDADAGTGRGDKMVYRTPSSTFNISDAEAQVIIDDGTYADQVGQ
jgi:hypothetical protein